MKQEQRMTIDFEKDQEEILDKTTNINKLSRQNKRNAGSSTKHN